MSTSPPPDPAGGPSTRQLLDELDALMQRMLALPVDQPDDDGPAPAAARDASAGTVTVSQLSHPLPQDSPEILADREPFWSRPDVEVLAEPDHARLIPDPLDETRLSPELVEAALREPTAASRPALAGPAPLLDEAPASAPAPWTSPPPVRTPAAAPPAALSSAPAPVPLGRTAGVSRNASARNASTRNVNTGPVLWINRTFDRVTAWFGAPGRWLRSGRGRALLGWLGLLLWAVALALVLIRFLG